MVGVSGFIVLQSCSIESLTFSIGVENGEEGRRAMSANDGDNGFGILLPQLFLLVTSW